MRLPPFVRRWAPLAMLIAAVLLMPALAHARAGGGEGFHSSGGGSHGSGGGGGGSGVDLVYLVLFCVRHPLFSLIVVVACVVIYQYLKRTGQLDNLTSSPTLGRPPTTDLGAVPRLRQNDPAFDPEAFCQRVAAGFLKLQDAWCRQDLKAVRPFISDAVHERFAIQFAEQKGAGYRDQMEQVGIDAITVADAATDAVYDTVSVRIVAHAADYRVSPQGQRISGSTAVEPFAEVWSFLRRRGAQTTPGKTGLLEGNCPNCAAPVELNESANCANCGALLRSGQYDWVLSEITQASEWSPGEQSNVPGLDHLRQRDPDLNVQAIEDRASVVFWRRAAADRIGKVDPLRKAATDDYLKTVADQLKPGPDGHRHYTGECAVGSVQTRAFLPATDAAGFDRAVVDVNWTGTRFTVDASGAPPRPGGESTVHTLLVLSRKADSKTDVAKGISSAHCPQCGAPESGGVGGACDFCGAALNDGSHGWVLTDIQPNGGPITAEIGSVL
jgi:hypothetical protein